jgi:hypothetical protein
MRIFYDDDDDVGDNKVIKTTKRKNKHASHCLLSRGQPCYSKFKIKDITIKIKIILEIKIHVRACEEHKELN